MSSLCVLLVGYFLWSLFFEERKRRYHRPQGNRHWRSAAFSDFGQSDTIRLIDTLDGPQRTAQAHSNKSNDLIGYKPNWSAVYHIYRPMAAGHLNSVLAFGSLSECSAGSHQALAGAFRRSQRLSGLRAFAGCSTQFNKLNSFATSVSI